MISRKKYRELVERVAGKGGHIELASLLDLQLSVLLDIRELLQKPPVTEEL